MWFVWDVVAGTMIGIGYTVGGFFHGAPAAAAGGGGGGGGY
jgi:hypothetical protein